MSCHVLNLKIRKNDNAKLKGVNQHHHSHLDVIILDNQVCQLYIENGKDHRKQS